MNTPLTATHVFFSPSSNTAIDTCTDDTPPRSHIKRETLKQIRQRYPDAIYIDWESACKIMDDANRLPVSEITESDFWEMLEVLPPVGWQTTPEGESFKMSERYSGNITSIYARVGTRYFHLRDLITLRHEDIITTCQAYIQANPLPIWKIIYYDLFWNVCAADIPASSEAEAVQIFKSRGLTELITIYPPKETKHEPTDPTPAR